jgi:polysaccharide export outer membrane protein
VTKTSVVGMRKVAAISLITGVMAPLPALRAQHPSSYMSAAGAAAPSVTPSSHTLIPGAGEDHTVPDYSIGAGDVLQVSVWKEPDASVPSVVVRPDGKIAMPLLKDVAVAGLTPAQAEAAITERLAPIIHDAEVTVVVTAINSKKIYVIGAVNKEGPIAYTYRMTALQALSEAGGLTEYAKRKKIYILRTENGKTSRLPFNYDQVIRGEKMDQNVQLSPGDTVVVRQ